MHDRAALNGARRASRGRGELLWFYRLKCGAGLWKAEDCPRLFSPTAFECLPLREERMPRPEPYPVNYWSDGDPHGGNPNLQSRCRSSL